MKLTKKAAALLLAAALAVSVCATPVFADGGTTGTPPANPSETGSETNKEVTTDVIYKVDSKYTWTIPATIDFGSNAGINKTRTVDANKGANDESTKATDTTNGTAPMVYVTENVIEIEKALKISIDTASSTFEAVNGFWVGVSGKKLTEKLYFEIAKPAEGSNPKKVLTSGDSEVLSVPSGTKKGQQALVLTLKTTSGEVEKAGEYTGTIAFKSEVK